MIPISCSVQQIGICRDVRKSIIMENYMNSNPSKNEIEFVRDALM